MATSSTKRMIFTGSRPSVTYDELWVVFDDISASKALLPDKDFMVMLNLICRFEGYVVGAQVMMSRTEDGARRHTYRASVIDGGVVKFGLHKQSEWGKRVHLEAISIDLAVTNQVDFKRLMSVFFNQDFGKQKTIKYDFNDLLDDINNTLMPPDEFEPWLDERLPTLHNENDSSHQFFEDAHDLYLPQLIRNALENLDTCS